MSSLNVKAAPVVVPTTGLEQLQKKAAVDLESEKARLKEATRQFESFFMYQMLKTMRETIPESSPAKDAPLSGDKSKDIFTDMFDMQIADKMASGDSNSIADILYKSLEKVVEAQYPSETAPNEIMPLDIGEKQPLELKQDDFRQIEEDDGPIEVRPRTEDLLPIQTPVRQITEDPVMSRYGRLI
ncbi:MAG: rod-binding protein, partial [candidate division Zixibacteria bacterium]|nr:rod-binding protein [candidate division Zixibacteria bacterium]